MQPVTTGVEFVADGFKQPNLTQPRQGRLCVLNPVVGRPKTELPFDRVRIGLKSACNQLGRFDPA